MKLSIVIPCYNEAKDIASNIEKVKAYLKDKKIIETIYNNLTNKNKFKNYFYIVNEFIETKLHSDQS